VCVGCVCVCGVCGVCVCGVCVGGVCVCVWEGVCFVSVCVWHVWCVYVFVCVCGVCVCVWGVCVCVGWVCVCVWGVCVCVWCVCVCISAVFASACPLARASFQNTKRIVTDRRSVSFGCVVCNPYCASIRNSWLFGVERICAARRPDRSPALSAVVFFSLQLN